MFNKMDSKKCASVCSHNTFFFVMILFIFVSAAKSSAFVPQYGVHHSLRISNSNTMVYMNDSPRPPDNDMQLERYNDDSFGLVFLAGGLISKDIVFATTFLTLSAIAAASTYFGILDADERNPGIVALATLLLSSIVTSFLVSSGSFENFSTPPPIETALCTISFLVSIFNWARREQAQ